MNLRALVPNSVVAARSVGACIGLGALAAACASGPSAEKVGASASDIVSCPASTVEGVDVSYYQGSIAWSEVAASGRRFAIARVSDGTGFPDPQFSTYYAGIKAAGMVRGSYQFFRPEQSASAQADLVIQAVGTLEDGDLPPVLDVEVTDGESSATIVAGITAWVSQIKASLGVEPIIYTAPGFWDGISGAGGLSGTTLWVANWEVSCPSLPSTWSEYSIWQYSDTGSVPGISGQVDLDRFNGTAAQLVAYANGGAPGGGGGPTTPGPSPAPTPTPPPAPASCYSNTLGREMSANACVQSASNGEWYQCDDGAWVDRWEDATACSGVYPLN
jgi:lysozyme